MKVPPHLIGFYRKTARRYNKLISKIHRETVSSYERKTFLHQLKKLFRKLRHLETQLKIAAATGAVVLLLNTGQVQAQGTPSSTLGPFVKQNRMVNPLPEPIFTGSNPAITVVDFDKDGDLDVVQGEYYDSWYGGRLRYFENQTTQGKPIYLEKFDEENPFSDIYAQTAGVAPALADIDEDGDLDLFMGQNGQNTFYFPGAGSGIEYYRNDDGVFSKQTGIWNENTKEGSPFEGLVLGEYVRPVFVDFDKDGDQDCIIGSRAYTGYPKAELHYVHYYENNGNGTFLSSPFTFNAEPNSWRDLSPAVADIDRDGDYDLLIGTYQYGYLSYYRQDSPGYFVSQNWAWNPVINSGNPFYEFELGSSASPAFIDFDQDGNLDLLVADESGYNKYSDSIIDYYKNSAGNTYDEIDGTENPFDGVHVNQYASPALIDLDGDLELDAFIGNEYNLREGNYYSGYIYTFSSLDHYKKNEENTFTLTPQEVNPFNDYEVNGYFSPQFVDVDGDGDFDMITGNDNGRVVFFRNEDGEFVDETDSGPFVNVSMDGASSARMVDIDNDGDLDVFATVSYGNIRFWENQDGTLQSDVVNPLDALSSYLPWNIPIFLNFADLDHDGDFDVVFNGYVNYQERGAIMYFENTGTPENPLFEFGRDEMFSDIDTNAPQSHFIDYDEDGDLDVFIGSMDGTVSYFENENEPVETTVTGATATYEPGKDEPVVVAPGISLSDPDDDLIIQAIISIEDYQPGEVLGFTPQDGITAFFDSETGMLHFTGKASAKVYEALLRTVTFEVIVDEAGRTKSPKATVEKNVLFAVYDIDFTHPQVAVKAVNVFVNTPPVIEPQQIITPAGSVKTLNLIEITSDAEGNLDPNSFSIVSQPTSHAVASIQFVSAMEVNLLLDYQGITFSGIDQMTIRACDDAAACSDRLLAIEVDVASGVVVYNAIAPNSSGDNKIMRITGLPEGNKVSVFNRWGDKVYEVENYQNISSGNAFQGLNQNGNMLPSGVYYYTIEIPGKDQINGYLTLKQ